MKATDEEREERIRKDVSGMLEWAGDVMDDIVFLLRRLDGAREAGRREGLTMAGVIEDEADDVDFTDGPAKPLKMGRVFYSDGSGNARPRDPSIAPGWYYQIDMAEPVGPFDTQLEAGKAARATIVVE